MRKEIYLFLILLNFSCQGVDVTTAEIPTLAEEMQAAQGVDSDSAARRSGLVIFEWEAIMCENKGYYEKDKYTKKQLTDTHYLWYGYNSSTIMDVDVTLDKPEYLNDMYIYKTSRKLDEEYAKASAKLKALDVVPTPFWLNQKELSLQQLEELYQLKKLTIEAFSSPAVILDTRYSHECESYVQALASGDSTALLDAWRKLVDMQKLNNGSPEGVERLYQQKLSTPEKLLYARIELMSYGWWNCANRQRVFVDGFNQEGQIEKEFEKLFEKVDFDCEDMGCGEDE